MATTYIYFTKGIAAVAVYQDNKPNLFFHVENALGPDGEKYIGTDDIDYSGGATVTFEAVLDDESEYEFEKWTYTVNNKNGTRLEKTENPVDISLNLSVSNFYIKAHSDAWELVERTPSAITITDKYRDDVEIESTTMYQYKVKFENSGKAKFYTEGELDTVGFLSTSDELNGDGNAPKKPIEENDDDGAGGHNFSFSYDVQAGEYYYVWLKGFGGGSGNTTLYIEPPSWNLDGQTSTIEITNQYERDIYINYKTLYVYPIKFRYSGTAEFYTEGSVDTVGFLSTKLEPNERFDAPSSDSIIVGGDDVGTDENFNFSYDVEANKIYYVWVKSYNGKYSGYTTLYIIPPESQQGKRPPDFDWTNEKTNGGDFNLTANEWNAFTSRINEFRDYKGLGAYSFTKAYPKNIVQAAMYNEAREAIRGISGYGEYIPYVYADEKITAHMMNILVRELNAIP